MPIFLSNDFQIADPTDTDKRIFFDLSGFAAGTTRNLDMSLGGAGAGSLTAIIAATNIGQTWTDGQTWDCSTNSFTFVDASGGPTGAGGGIIFSNGTKGIILATVASITANAVVRLPDATGTLALFDAAQTWSALQTFPDNAITIVGSATASKALLFELDGATAAKTVTLKSDHTADRTVTLPDLTGILTPRGPISTTAVDAATGGMISMRLTGQTADITSVKLTNAAPAGNYLLPVVLSVTTNDGTAGSVTVTISWTGAIGATSTTVSRTLTTVARGTSSASLPIDLASGDITFAVTHTGTYGTAVYALDITPIYLG